MHNIDRETGILRVSDCAKLSSLVVRDINSARGGVTFRTIESLTGVEFKSTLMEKDFCNDLLGFTH